MRRALPVPSTLALLALLSLGLRAQAAASPVVDPPAPGEPAVVRSTVSDDQVRIEELRVRGQTRKLTVQPLRPGFQAYDILPPEPGRAPEQDPKAGQRVWFSLTF